MDWMYQRGVQVNPRRTERHGSVMYRFGSRIRYSEVDSSGKLTLPSLLDYFQDCSTFQSEDLGVGVEYLGRRNLAWVLSAWQIVVERYPELCETVSVGTIPYEIRNFVGYRNFLMETTDGMRLACANTIWMLMDMGSGKPVKATQEMLDAYETGEKLEMDYAPRKIILPAAEGAAQETVEIKSHHLDTNRHVNNGQYVRMAMEYLPEGYEIRQMRAEYKKQAHFGDHIHPLVYTGDGTVAVSLNGREGQPYCIVEFCGNADRRKG